MLVETIIVGMVDVKINMLETTAISVMLIAEAIMVRLMVFICGFVWWYW